MRKTRDILYTIFIGFILFLAGAVILGGVEYFLYLLIGFDFLSVIVFFLLARYLTILVLKGITNRGLFYSIFIPILVFLMFILKNFVFFTVYFTISGENFFEVISSIPMIFIRNFISRFIYSSEIGIGQYILNLFDVILDIAILIVGMYQSYKLTKYR